MTEPGERDDLADEIAAAFRRGEADRARAQTAVARGLARYREALEAARLGLEVEGTDFDGLFARANPHSPVGWWAYLVVHTNPAGMTYSVRAGFGRKNEPESLRDTLPELHLDSVDAALEALGEAVVAGAYYLGSLRRA